MLITMSLPKNAELLAEKGKKITYHDPLYRMHNGSDHIIDIGQKLSISPKHIFNYMIKMVGEKVRKNEIIAHRKNTFSVKNVHADTDGVIQKIDHLSGHITIHIDKDENHIVQSFFTGTIQEKENNTLTIYLEKGQRIELVDITHDSGGKIFYFTDESLYFNINEEGIKNRIVIIEYLSPHIQIKCEALGARGFGYVEKKGQIVLPHMVFKKDDYIKMLQSRQTFIICSAFEKSAILYE
ncbi:MAG TPA: hypothetical protein VJB63_04630 [Patescibacteria group bacterium]|nr:hypothetical protein [Patescibacteria group bacterium]